MTYIKFIKPGLLTSIQDAGRYGYQQFGMPVSGAMDILSLQFANFLVGNDRFEACLEASFIGPKIKIHANTTIGITGADMQAKLNGKTIPMYESVQVKNGDELNFSACVKACRTYIAFSGGFSFSPIMNSKSTYIRGGVGGLNGNSIQEADIIDLQKSDFNEIRKIPKELLPNYEDHYEARIIPGPEANFFTIQGLANFKHGEFKLTTQCDRMGYRLSGEKILHKKDADILSSGINFGSIQVPKHGDPIIMMADRQTTGGYPRIANIISSDLPYIAQLQPGDTITFKEVNLNIAEEIANHRENQLKQLFPS